MLKFINLRRVFIRIADLASILKFKMLNTICHEHLEVQHQVIMNLTNNNELKVFDIKENKINGGSKQYFISLKHSNIPIKKTIINKYSKLNVSLNWIKY